MGKTTIQVACIDQRLSVISPPVIASGGKNEDLIAFEFCPFWVGCAKTPVFYRDKSTVYHATVTDDQCVIPWEVLAEDGIMYFGVFGVKGNITRTSEVIRYRVTLGAITEDTKPSDPTPDIYEQLLSKLAAIETFTVPAEPYSVSGGMVQLDNFDGIPMNVVTRLEPIQAGEGEPYPGGAGKNLLENTATTQTINGVTFTVNTNGSITANGTTTERTQMKVGEVDLPAGDYIVSKGFTTTNGSTAYLVYAVDGEVTYIDTAGDVERAFTLADRTNISYFIDIRNTGVTANNLIYYPMIRLASEADATYAPYSNIRPISGHTGDVLTRCGKNLLPNVRIATSEVNGVTLTNNGDGSYTLNGTASAYTQLVDSESFHLPAGSYVLSASNTDANNHGQLRSADGLTIFANTISEAAGAFTLDANTEVKYRHIVNADKTINALRIYPMIRLASITDATYEPYQGETFSASFGQTVYGGTLDWNTGVLTVDRVFVALTADNTTYRNTNYDGTCGIFVIGYSGMKTDNAHVADAVCSHCKAETANTQYVSNINCVAINNNGQVLITFKDIVTAEDGKAYVTEQANAGTPVQVCYKLATPTTIQLTPQDIHALQGENNLWSSAGDVTVSGRKDILWLTQNLMRRIQELEATLATLEAAALTE